MGPQASDPVVKLLVCPCIVPSLLLQPGRSGQASCWQLVSQWMGRQRVNATDVTVKDCNQLGGSGEHWVNEVYSLTIICTLFLRFSLRLMCAQLLPSSLVPCLQHFSCISRS